MIMSCTSTLNKFCLFLYTFVLSYTLSHMHKHQAEMTQVVSLEQVLSIHINVNVRFPIMH